MFDNITKKIMLYGFIYHLNDSRKEYNKVFLKLANHLFG